MKSQSEIMLEELGYEKIADTSIVEVIEQARLAQQAFMQKHDVQLELPAQWLVLDCVYNRMWYPTLVNTIVVGDPPGYAVVHRVG